MQLGLQIPQVLFLFWGMRFTSVMTFNRYTFPIEMATKERTNGNIVEVEIPMGESAAEKKVVW